MYLHWKQDPNNQQNPENQADEENQTKQDNQTSLDSVENVDNDVDNEGSNSFGDNESEILKGIESQDNLRLIEERPQMNSESNDNCNNPESSMDREFSDFFEITGQSENQEAMEVVHLVSEI